MSCVMLRRCCVPLSLRRVHAQNTTPPRGPTLTAIASRHLFETTARQLVSGNPHVEFGYGAMVAGLVFDDGQSDVGGAGGVAGETEEEGAAAAAADRGQRVDKQAPKAVTGGWCCLRCGVCVTACQINLLSCPCACCTEEGVCCWGVAVAPVMLACAESPALRCEMATPNAASLSLLLHTCCVVW